MPQQSLPASTPGTARVRIHVLGRLLVEVEQAPLRFEGRAPRRPLELLKTLIALGGDGVPTESLCDALWPDADGDSAANALSVNLARLRSLIGTECVRNSNARVSLAPELCWVDALECESLLAQARRDLAAGHRDRATGAVEQAIALYQGPLLDGEFEPAPILSARERLHSQFLHVVEELGGVHEEAGQPQVALDLYRRALERDDQAEPFYQGVMRICLATGRRAEGLAAFQRCESVLRAALGTAPDAETLRLRAALQDAPGVADKASAAETEPPDGPVTAATGAPGGRRHGPALALVAVLALAGVATWGGWFSRTSPDTSATGTRAQPSVFVLPFANPGGDPQHDALSEGLSEELITRLASLDGLRVVAPAAAFGLDRHGRGAAELGRELGVDYVLEGTVRREGARTHITARLLDVESGRYLWARGTEGEDGNLFAAREDILRRIVGTLQVPLQMGTEGWRRHASTDNVQAWEQYLLGLAYLRQGTTLGFMLARYRFENAVQLDGAFSAAILGIAWSQYRAYRLNLGGGGLYMLEQAEAAVRRAREMHGDPAEADALQAGLHLMRRRYDQALISARNAVDASPAASEWQAVLAEVLTYRGDNVEALAAMRKALARSPVIPERYQELLGAIYYGLGRFEDAIAVLQPLMDKQPKAVHAHLAASFAALGRQAEARAAAQGLADLLVASIPTGFTIEPCLAWKHPYRNVRQQAELLERLKPLVESTP